jgi:hypothetical protein
MDPIPTPIAPRAAARCASDHPLGPAHSDGAVDGAGRRSRPNWAAARRPHALAADPTRAAPLLRAVALSGASRSVTASRAVGARRRKALAREAYPDPAATEGHPATRALRTRRRRHAARANARHRGSSPLPTKVYDGHRAWRTTAELARAPSRRALTPVTVPRTPPLGGARTGRCERYPFDE